jgi:hypothetical protein
MGFMDRIEKIIDDLSFLVLVLWCAFLSFVKRLIGCVEYDDEDDIL